MARHSGAVFDRHRHRLIGRRRQTWIQRCSNFLQVTRGIDVRFTWSACQLKNRLRFFVRTEEGCQRVIQHASQPCSRKPPSISFSMSSVLRKAQVTVSGHPHQRCGTITRLQYVRRPPQRPLSVKYYIEVARAEPVGVTVFVVVIYPSIEEVVALNVHTMHGAPDAEHGARI